MKELEIMKNHVKMNGLPKLIPSEDTLYLMRVSDISTLLYDALYFFAEQCALGRNTVEYASYLTVRKTVNGLLYKPAFSPGSESGTEDAQPTGGSSGGMEGAPSTAPEAEKGKAGGRRRRSGAGGKAKGGERR
jgi:hypothetical protein